MWRGYGYGESRKRADEALSRVGLEKYANSLNRRLSGGMKRKVLLSMVLASEAEIIFLDEPSTGLDPISRREPVGLLVDLGEGEVCFPHHP